MYDLIILGGGAAGITAAVYALRRSLNVLLISEDLGGKTAAHHTLPSMTKRLVTRGSDVVDKFREELQQLDFSMRQEMAQKVFKRPTGLIVKTQTGQELPAKSVVLATGSQTKRLNVPGEREFFRRGLSYSAISYASFFTGRQTAVIGDNRLALRAVAELAQVADKVYLVAPTHGALDSPLGEKIAADKMRTAILEGYQVTALHGNDHLRRMDVQSPTGLAETLEVDGVFVELGLIPNSDPVRELVDLDAHGYVMIDHRNRTSCPGLFAAGDVTNAYVEQALVAVGEGIKAALNAYDYLLANF